MEGPMKNFWNFKAVDKRDVVDLMLIVAIFVTVLIVGPYLAK